MLATVQYTASGKCACAWTAVHGRWESPPLILQTCHPSNVILFLFSYSHILLHLFLVWEATTTLSHNLPPLLFRCQDGSGSGSGNAPLDQRFLLKWSVPLNFVEVLEFGSSEDMADNNRYPAPHSGEKVVINAKPSMKHNVTLFYLNLVDFLSGCNFDEIVLNVHHLKLNKCT